MNRPNPKLLLTGIFAGVTAALLVLGAIAQPSWSAVLYAASALPVLIVGLGWGNVPAITAIVTAGALGALLISPSFALIMTMVTLAPAGWLSHLANLARPASEIGGPDDLIAWYPLSDILLHLCGLVTLGVVVGGYMIGYGPELTGRIVDAMIASVQVEDSSFGTDPAVVDQIKRLILLIFPMMQGAVWVIMLFAAYYTSTRLVLMSGGGLRPREDIPSSLRMNRNAVFIFLAGLAASFSGGIVALIGAAVCGTFGAGFLLAGFASLHFRTRGMPFRLSAIVFSYLAATMLLPALIILVAGMADTRRAIALSPTAKKKQTDQTDP